jgi:pimeloyl-ACP methyl ester carboxylesterase
MYQNQNFKKGAVIVALIIGVVFSLGEAKNNNQGPDIDDIYAGIRYSAPMYEWEESIVTFENEGMTLVCTLTIPQIQKKCPIVITLVGFYGTRDGDPTATGEKSFQRLSRIMAGQGFASLRVDFRGTGDSDGDFSMTTFSSQISDTMAAVDYIKSDLKHLVKSESIGILGFSQGGLVGTCAAARDKEVDSLVLWSATAFPSHDYEGVLSKQGIKAGLSLEAGGSITLPFMVEGTYLWDVNLEKGFFEELFSVVPLAEMRDYKNPVMYVAGTQDVIVWPQPTIGKTFLKCHDGYEKLVVLNADHTLNFWEGPVPEKYDDAVYWSTAWFIKTLK